MPVLAVLFAAGALSMLAAALILIAVASTAIPFSSPARAAAKGKIVLAWHATSQQKRSGTGPHEGAA